MLGCAKVAPLSIMILCVTLNPCLDKTLSVPAWKPGDSVRGLAVREGVGGKGNNVARALHRTGHAGIRPVTFLGGFTGAHCTRLLKDQDQLEPLAISTKAETRVILTVRTQQSAEQTAFFDPDPVIEPNEIEQLLTTVELELKSEQVRALTLSGSSPCPATHGAFSDLIALAQARGVPTFLDTYGPALDSMWGFWPSVIQLNRREAAQHLGLSRVQDTDLLGLLYKWQQHGVLCSVITNGPDSALAQVRGQYFRVTPPKVDVVNPIGSGDSMLAGQVDGWLNALDAESLLRRAMAYGVANAMIWDAGQLEPATIAELEPRMLVEPVPVPTRVATDVRSGGQPLPGRSQR